MATASSFTKVSVISSWTVKEARAMVELIEHCTLKDLTTQEQIAVSAVHQSLIKALANVKTKSV